MIVNQPNLTKFLNLCHEGHLGGFEQVIVPRPSMADPANLHYTPVADAMAVVFDRYRTVEPIRMLFYWPRDQVVPQPEKAPRRIIAGVKACDLKALQLLDKALINDKFIDPAYKA